MAAVGLDGELAIPAEQKEAFTKCLFEDISSAYACAIEWRHSALPEAQLSLCGRKC